MKHGWNTDKKAGQLPKLKWFGLSPWLDASGPEDAARYRKRSEAGTWKGFAAPKVLGTTTSGRLLQSKRTRDLPGELLIAAQRT